MTLSQATYNEDAVEMSPSFRPACCSLLPLCNMTHISSRRSNTRLDKRTTERIHTLRPTALGLYRTSTQPAAAHLGIGPSTRTNVTNHWPRKQTWAASANMAEDTAAVIGGHINVQVQSAFFTELNYDVRCVIYDYLYLSLPPLARKWHANGVPQEDCCRGLVLSCRLANKVCFPSLRTNATRPNTWIQEVMVAAGRHLKTYLSEFQEDFKQYYGKPINLYSELKLHTGWEAMRCVTLSIAVKHLPSRKDHSPGFQYRLDIDVDIRFFWGPFRKLLEQPFDKVTLLFICPEAGNAPPEEEVLNSLWHHLMEMHGTISTAISQEWQTFQDQDDEEKLRLYRENPSLILPHLRRSDVACCHKCSSECSLNWECMHTDSCSPIICRDECPGKCNGKDRTCRWVHRLLPCKLSGICNYEGDEDRTPSGPKRRNHNSDDEYRFACLQWERLRSRVDVGEYDYHTYTFRRIQTKEIVLAWDYRNSTKQLYEPLLGEKRRYQQARVAKLARANSLRVPHDDEEYDERWPYECYMDLKGWDDVMDNDSLAGMWVLGHPKC